MRRRRWRPSTAQCDVVLSPSASADASLARAGRAAERIGRWDRGVDLTRFSPELRTRAEDDGDPVVLYAGRLTREKGIDLLADAFLRARERDPRLRLVLAGGGPEEEALRARLGDAAEFLGWLDGDALAHAYANADVFLFASETDTFGQVILEAQASGLPVRRGADAGGPRELIAHGRSGCLAPAERGGARPTRSPTLAARPALRARLAARRPRGGARALLGARARPARRRLRAGAGRCRGRRRRRCGRRVTP